MRKLTWLMAGALALSGCSLGQDIPAAQQAVGTFHHQLDGGQFDTIWQASSGTMKQSGPKDSFVGFLGMVHRKLGSFRSSKQTGWNEQIATGGHFITLVYQAQYEKGDAEENFVFRIENGKPLLAGYHVNSNLFFAN